MKEFLTTHFHGNDHYDMAGVLWVDNTGRLDILVNNTGFVLTGTRSKIVNKKLRRSIERVRIPRS